MIAESVETLFAKGDACIGTILPHEPLPLSVSNAMTFAGWEVATMDCVELLNL